jgi:hypothetical protein
MNALQLQIREEVIIQNCLLFFPVSLKQQRTKSWSGRSLFQNFAAIGVNLLYLESIDFAHRVSLGRYKYQEYCLSSIFEAGIKLKQYHYQNCSFYRHLFEASQPFFEHISWPNLSTITSDHLNSLFQINKVLKAQ